MGIMKDIMTCSDGESYDVVRVAMTVIIALLPFVMIWGITMTTIGYFRNQPFDMNGAFTAVMAFLTGAGAFLMSGAGALFFKRSTEPQDPSTNTEGK